MPWVFPGPGARSIPLTPFPRMNLPPGLCCTLLPRELLVTGTGLVWVSGLSLAFGVDGCPENVEMGQVGGGQREWVSLS